MKNATKFISRLTILAALIIIGSLTSANTTTYAQEANVVTPPDSEQSCKEAKGKWSPTNEMCRDYNGREEWVEFAKEHTGITSEDECREAGGQPTSTILVGDARDTFIYCRDYEGYQALVDFAQGKITQEEFTQKKSEIDSKNDTLADEVIGEASECNVGGMGWAICPISNALAGAVDGIYEGLVNFVRIPPVSTTGDNNQIYSIWVTFRNIANIIFVLFMLVAIVSQMSNIGMSNYGVKRLLPRVVVAAVLVNISIYLCIIMVDISNIIGQSIYELLTRLSMGISLPVDGSTFTWASVTAAALSGVTVGGIAMVGAGAGGASTVGLIIAPIILMAVMAAFTAFVILALRYILIYLLIAISPIAFVMYLLPNTSKYFDKWKDIFITILFFYPLFSLLFGTASIVSKLAISSASSSDMVGIMGPTMLLFGLFIQVAPLLLSYKLLQTANSVAGTVTNGLQRKGDGYISAAKNRRDKGVAEGFSGGMNRMKAYGGSTQGKGKKNPAALLGRAATASRVRRGKVSDRREAWSDMAEQNFLKERDADDSAQVSNYSARAAKLGVSELNSLQQSQFIKSLGETKDKLDANGNPIYKLDEHGDPTTETKKIYSPYAVIASGDDQSSIQSITRQARAQQVSEERKAYTAEFSGSAIPQLKSALIEAMQSGNTSKTQALQSLLYGSGGKGVDTVREVISQEQSKGSAANQEVLSAMSQNILANHGDMKSRDNAQMEWAISGENIKSIVENPSFGANLSEKDKASQTPGNMYEMAKNGNLTGETAARILDNQNLSIGLKDDQRAILEAMRDGTPLPTPPPSAPTAAKAPQPQPAAAAASTPQPPQPPQPSNPPQQGPSAPPRQGPNNFNG